MQDLPTFFQSFPINQRSSCRLFSLRQDYLFLSPLSDLGSIHGCSMVFPCFSHGLCPARSPPLQPVPFFTHSLPAQLPTWPLFTWSFFSCHSRSHYVLISFFELKRLFRILDITGGWMNSHPDLSPSYLPLNSFSPLPHL